MRATKRALKITELINRGFHEDTLTWKPFRARSLAIGRVSRTYTTLTAPTPCLGTGEEKLTMTSTTSILGVPLDNEEPPVKKEKTSDELEGSNGAGVMPAVAIKTVYGVVRADPDLSTRAAAGLVILGRRDPWHREPSSASWPSGFTYENFASGCLYPPLVGWDIRLQMGRG
ncbi:uncharacterized protein ISCGN_013173 [Ixodes scapularis]